MSNITKEEKQNYYNIAATLNNHPALITQDHVTIMFFMDTKEELDAHISKLQSRVDAYIPKKTRKRKTA